MLMNTLIPQRKRLAGFSLVELAIALLIMGILMSAGLSLATVRRAAAQRDVTQTNQEAIKQALIHYLGQNKRLPCPGNTNDGSEYTRTIAFTGTAPPPCPSYTGIVPYKELGLDRAAALDGWENFITYVISQNITPLPPPFQPVPSAAQQIAPAPVLTTAWVYSYNNSTTITSNTSPYTKTNTTNPPNPWVNPLSPLLPTPTIANDSAFWPSTSTGSIQVALTVASTPYPLIASPTQATGAVVTLISHGKNGFGAVNVKGGTNDYASAGADEKQNITPTSGVPATVVKRDPTDSPTAVGGPFDDIVMIISTNDLTGPLIANGTLQYSAQAALSQANDIVKGNIVWQKASCTLSPPPPAVTTVGHVCSPGTNYYYLTPSAPITFPANVSAWGVSYLQGTTYVDVSNFYPLTAPYAYSLTAGDGTQKIVTIQELQGSLLNAGSN